MTSLGAPTSASLKYHNSSSQTEPLFFSNNSPLSNCTTGRRGPDPIDNPSANNFDCANAAQSATSAGIARSTALIAKNLSIQLRLAKKAERDAGLAGYSAATAAPGPDLPTVKTPEWSRYGAITPTHLRHQQVLLEHLGHLWADNTWKGYAGVFGRMLEFCQQFELDPQQDANACLWICSLGIEIQGMHQYAKNLSAVMNRLGWKTVNIAMLAAALRRQGALTPIKQAEAISLAELHLLLRILPKEHHLAVMIAWATASRWDDLVLLVRSMFIQLKPHQVIINWFDTTKSSASNPYLETMLVVVEGSFCQTICEEVSRFKNPQQPVTTLSTTQFDKLMTKLGQKWSGHSFKKGAANAIVKACAAGLCPISLLPTVLKHQQKDDLASVSIRYISNKVDLALALGTGQATRFL